MSRIPYPLPEHLRRELKTRGTEAVIRFNAMKQNDSNQAIADYEEAARLLELTEKQIRKQLGVMA